MTRVRERRRSERRRGGEVFLASRDKRQIMSGVRTRAQKRRIGERDVWDLIVNNDDICFKHILPRLNSNDVKFLYGVNSETRKLIKRSSRESDLKKRFAVREMSSISTLEIAWESRENKSLWWVGWSETYFCRVGWSEAYFCLVVAQTNKLELLKWAREEKECRWNYRTINAAAVIVYLSHSHFFFSRAHLSNSSLFV